MVEINFGPIALGSVLVDLEIIKRALRTLTIHILHLVGSFGFFNGMDDIHTYD